MRTDHKIKTMCSCPHCRDLAECREVAEKRRAQRDHADDMVKAMAVELDEMRRENRRLRELLKDRHSCRCRCEHEYRTGFERHYHEHHEYQCGGRR